MIPFHTEYIQGKEMIPFHTEHIHGKEIIPFHNEYGGGGGRGDERNRTPLRQ